MARGMKIHEAKNYVAQKLNVDLLELTDEEIMRPLREELGIGTVTSVAGSPKGMRAKLKIAELLDIPIRSAELFKAQL